MSRWSLDDIPWQSFDASKVAPELVSVVKAACMVEHNGYDYARYLCEVFSDDPAFQKIANEWAEEEVQHGQALRKWAELADPTFDFNTSFSMFTTGYKLPVNVAASVRGSRIGELISRCVVETGTSSYYTAIANQTDEPVLKAICRKIAADEFCHYKLFYTQLKRYVKLEKVGFWERLKVALGRITESEDDELAYAFYAAHYDGAPYDHELHKNRYLARALALYRKEYIAQMVLMVFKAVGLKPYKLLHKAVTQLAWSVLKFKSSRLESYRGPITSSGFSEAARAAA